MASEDGVDVHLMQGDRAVDDLPLRNDFKIANEGRGFGTSVGFNQPDDDVHALMAQHVSLFEHAVRFAHAGRSAQIDAQLCVLRCRALGIGAEVNLRAHISRSPLDDAKAPRLPWAA